MQMKKIMICAALAVLVSCHPGKKDANLCLWYDEPARDWNECLPLGNGRLGAMVFG